MNILNSVPSCYLGQSSDFPLALMGYPPKLSTALCSTSASVFRWKLTGLNRFSELRVSSNSAAVASPAHFTEHTFFLSLLSIPICLSAPLSLCVCHPPPSGGGALEDKSDVLLRHHCGHFWCIGLHSSESRLSKHVLSPAHGHKALSSASAVHSRAPFRGLRVVSAPQIPQVAVV